MSNSKHIVWFALSAIAFAVQGLAQAQTVESTGEDAKTLPVTTVRATAEQELKQALGVSVITRQDLEERAPANDLSELIRTMPGVNLTGNSASGQFGNSRQIDLRGMGPENTMIMIDGKPVQSRNASKMGRSGERDTRGDSNWVPVEAIESIEVIRGPAAARYGSGAGGGVVNIITKKPGDKFAGSATVYTNRPEHSEEGDTRRASFNLSGPVAENFSFRLYGNVAKTDADDTSLNSHVSGLKLPPAGREGVRNRDLNALLRWDLTPQQVLELETGVSRQGNIYTGERLMDSNTNANNMLALLGQETNITHRNTVGLTHRGQWDWGTSRLLFQTENTRRTQYPVGLAGGAEGSITSTAASNMVTSRLHNYFLNGEVNTPFNLGGQRHMLTSGFEYRNEKLDDPGANRQSSISSSGDDISRLTGSGGQRTGKADAQTWAIYVEDNFEPLKSLIVTPGLRFDHHSQSGNNWSPSLNTTYHLSEQWSVKGGVARAFKAPNLYQTNSNYLYYTRGNGCPLNSPSIGGGCYIRGNPDLHAETSVNKELGLAFNGGEGLDASLSYFQNDYRNKIYAEMNDNAPTVIGRTKVFQWMNASRAVVRGVEGNLTLPLLGKRGDTLKWINNFTYMIKNHNKATQQPLSVIPEYTVNSTLDWRVTPQWSTQLYATFYGRQKPRTIGSGGYAATGNALTELGSYATFGLGAQYQVRRELSLNFGVNNIADKRLFRNASNSAGGAATYNEPGRTYYVSLTGRF